MNEKRRHYRFRMTLPATFRLARNPNHVYVSTVLDLSVKGLRISSTQKVPKGEPLIIHVRLPSDESVTMAVTVVWIREVRSVISVEYCLGIEIDESMQMDEARFVRFYARQLADWEKDRRHG